MTSKKIRQQFLDFFVSKQHEIVDSSPVVPHDDPTLMFTNAGMNQFKDVFVGTGNRNYTRATDTQKCIRAGGKHNDLDDVGQDTYHHTYFEMLGNWSFGDYFKKEAIEWAWELLTGVWGIEKDRLHATYFEGDQAEGLEPDTEAAELWKTVTDIDHSHIHPGNKKDNFWEMGDTGPCGPCSEIHIDLTPDKSGASLVNAGDARVIELWNLVFIQFNRASDGKLSPLPAKHVDTGLGFERLVAVLQGMETNQFGQVSNYDTDLFTPIFNAIQKRTGAPDYKGTLPTDFPNRDHEGAANDTPPLYKRGQEGVIHEQIMVDVSYRVIADHIRCLTFALTDGAIPSNEGRGYVLRRILRRAIRYGRQYLNMHEPFLCDLVESLVEQMADIFPELRTAHGKKNVQHVTELIRDEEASFGKTLDRGIKLFNSFALVTRAMANDQTAIVEAKKRHPGWDHPDEKKLFRAAGTNIIPGAAVFKLYDTYGFPPDLTELMAAEAGLKIDKADYENRMLYAQETARSAKSGDQANFTIQGAIDSTSVGIKYWSDHCQTIIVGYAIKDTYFRSGPIPPSVELAIVTSDTCFYAEQGGQIGDTGFIQKDGQNVFDVSATIWHGDGVLHIGQTIDSRISLNVGDEVWLEINDRSPIKKNHTSTHIMNWALREVLCTADERENPHMQQKGSLVDPEKTRFDFSHNKPLTNEELHKIESLVNEQIKADLKIYTKEVDQQKAREINTLRAVFGEKYPDEVRLVSIGADIDEMLKDPKNEKWMQYSVEFCGGTHLKSSKETDHFILIAEEGVAKGIRRVVGISGDAARNAETLGQQLLDEIEALSDPNRDRKRAEPHAHASVGVAPGQDEDSTTLAGKPPVAPENQSSDRERTEPHAHTSVGMAPDDHAPDDLGTQLSAFQQKLNEAVIPIRVRHQLRDAIAKLQKKVKEQQKQESAASGVAAMDIVAKLFESAESIGGVTVIIGEIPTVHADALRGAIDWVRNKTESSAVFLVTSEVNKVTLIAGMSKTVVSNGVKAGDLIQEIAPIVGGRGGGRPDMAQGGGSDPTKIPEALERAKSWIAKKLS